MIKNTEFYTSPLGEVMVKPEGEPVRRLEESGKENREFIQSFLDEIMEFYPGAFEALSKMYSSKEQNRIHYEFWIVSRFIRCNFGEYDYLNPDIDSFGRFRFEEVRCPLRGECKLSGIVCKPEFRTGLSKRETEITKLFVDHYSIDEVAERLFISPFTVANHLRHIHIKTNTRTLADLIDYWHTHNINKNEY